MRPIKLKMLRVWLKTKRAPKAPMKEKGIERSTMIGCPKLSNCAARTMYAITIPSSIANIR